MIDYKIFLSELEKAINAANRDIKEIELIAVSKKKPISEIKKIIDQKHISYGENQLQEIEEKWAQLKNEFSNLRLHFIGGIQSRKVKAIFNHCDVIHSLDRMKIVKQFWNTTFCGVYFKVVKTGFVKNGDELQLVKSFPENPTIADLYEKQKPKN